MVQTVEFVKTAMEFIHLTENRIAFMESTGEMFSPNKTESKVVRMRRECNT